MQNSLRLGYWVKFCSMHPTGMSICMITGRRIRQIKISPEFPSGEEITSIRIYKPTLLSAVNERLLYIATWNGTRERCTSSGFNPASGRLTSQTPLNTFEGFGKVADMNIKPHFNTW